MIVTLLFYFIKGLANFCSSGKSQPGEWATSSSVCYEYCRIHCKYLNEHHSDYHLR